MTLLTWKLVPWYAVEVAKQQLASGEKRAEGTNWLNELAEYLQLFPGTTIGRIPNHPSPLASMLVGGITGAGLGYGAGWLGEKFLPRKWRSGNTPRTMALLGGALGTAPGMLWAATNVRSGRPAFSNTVGDTPMPNEAFPLRANPPAYPGDPEGVTFGSEKKALLRGSGLTMRGSGLTMRGVPPIDVDQFNEMVWEDPRVSRRLPPQLQAAASGLITGAAHLPGKSNSNYVTPLDVGRMAAGMGAGLLSGAVVGKALGLALGAPTEVQDTLKTTGLMAGLIKSLIPVAFGGRD